METQLLRFKQLQTEFNQLELVTFAEPTIFSIGSKGYYENPTTDILAFFCDSNGQHQLGDTALKALLRCLPDEYRSLDSSLIETPEREVKTQAGKRIDLLLESTDWVMVLENKIYHQQNNPFEDYERFIQEEQNQTRFNGKQVLFVVLSPTGETLRGWCGISYPELITALKTELADQFLSQSINKWTLLLREFILHLESLMSQPSVNQQTLDFVLNNLSAIKEIQETKQQAINEYHKRLQTAIQSKLGKDIAIRLHHWRGYPAMRFALSSWKDTMSDVVLFLSGDKGESSINVYAHLCDGYDEHKADSLILTDSNVRRWVEGSGQYRGYRIEVAAMSENEIIQFICERLSELDKFESDYQGEDS
ncbi:PD-(D/E)XK nuclease family protein [Xenorhabdus stockiae]|uniref:PDDEXK-like family protein n=1 Tax=Xenorhabdus stockiae TaxID=351614 RepID=UPI003CEFBE30